MIMFDEVVGSPPLQLGRPPVASIQLRPELTFTLHVEAHVFQCDAIHKPLESMKEPVLNKITWRIHTGTY